MNFHNGVVAMDCEMVGVNNAGETQMLARVAIVNETGQVLLDKYVKPQYPVVDYRTSISGIRPHNLANGEEFNIVQSQVADLLRGRILVGHSLAHNLAVLRLEHPPRMIRDTAKYRPLMEHSSVEDAKASMGIYNLKKFQWEKDANK